MFLLVLIINGQQIPAVWAVLLKERMQSSVFEMSTLSSVAKFVFSVFDVEHSSSFDTFNFLTVPLFLQAAAETMRDKLSEISICRSYFL